MGGGEGGGRRGRWCVVGMWGREVGVGVLLGRGTSVDGAGGRVSWGLRAEGIGGRRTSWGKRGGREESMLN